MTDPDIASAATSTALPTAPFGTWASPISAELIAGATIRLGQTALAGRDIFWSEGRPQEGGRNVVVHRRADGSLHDVNPAPYNVRTRVHEYGGGAFVVDGDGIVFSHYDDQRLYRVDAAGHVVPLTHGTGLRYADADADPSRRRLIAVREDHREAGAEAVNTLVAIDLGDGTETVLAQGHDFFSTPRVRPGGRQLAWLTWDHPQMPWDGSTLWLAEFDAEGRVVNPRAIAGSGGGESTTGGSAGESIFQPSWSPGGDLHFVSDRSGWWNLYRLQGIDVQALLPMQAEFGKPQWAFGMSTYGFDGRNRIVCTCVQDGDARLLALDAASGAVETIATPFRVIEELKVGNDFVVFLGGSADASDAVVRLELFPADGAAPEPESLRSASSAALDAAFVSVAEAIRFPTEGGLDAHAFFYAPRHPGFQGPAAERPPLIVMTHGGPTSATSASFRWNVQYWTSRGFAVVDVDYGGSSGYGRAYRDRLKSSWGVVDVDDAINAARHLVARGEADADRIAVRGGSAGGYTTLSALTFRRFFKAGASHYGIGDLEALARDTHKFESRYLDGLIGPYPAEVARYRERSPVHHTAELSSAMILFQGAEDMAVPPSQAEAMFAAVKAKGLPVAYLLFEGEQHGFRRAETIRRVLDAELYFYGRIFGFVPAGEIEPVDIVNLPAGTSALPPAKP